jgi:hypothetical protein
MKTALLLFLCFFVAAPIEASTKSRILPFKVWKQKKIDEAKSVVSELKRDLKKISQVKHIDIDEEADKENLVRKLYQAELNLGVVKELSANDYFVLYVTPQFKNNSEALLQAAKALKSKDVADILSAYQRKLQAPEVVGAKTAPAYEDTLAEEPTPPPL